jgi:hypothetical protein
MGQALAFSTTLETLTCGECGILFAVPDWWLRRRRSGDDGTRDFCCPNGHCRVFTDETEAAKLRRELERERKRREWAETNERSQREMAEQATRRASSYQGHFTRIRKRAANGVCPWCHRSFVKLAQHVAIKHPQQREKHRCP